ELSYHFLETEPSVRIQGAKFSIMPLFDISDFSAFNEEQKDAARLSLQSWSDVANIKFTEVDSMKKANITFGFFDYSSSDDYAFATLPNGQKTAYSWYHVKDQTFADNDIGVNGYAR
ncbi:matrixin family metalloprotease, partial [Enterobacter hormaechei]|nr:matrixin family metalloprotease [Enterobacter hormaechei]